MILDKYLCILYIESMYSGVVIYAVYFEFSMRLYVVVMYEKGVWKLVKGTQWKNMEILSF